MYIKKKILKKIKKIIEKKNIINNFFIKNKNSYNFKENIFYLKKYSKIKPIISLYSSYKKIEKKINLTKELLSDNEIKEYVKNEIKILKKKLYFINKQIEKKIFFKKNKKNIIFLEIRAGTGGKESSLFVNDLLNMYIKYSNFNNWKLKIISYNISNIGGYKEIILKIKGKNVYNYLKFESGCHRVQRIPKTETQGRIHTSTCTVAVILQVNNIKNIKINNSDIKIDTYKSSGAGGQHVNKTDSAVRIKHIPTGIIVECQNNRSQHKNKKLALKILLSKINNLKLKKNNLKISKKRKLLIGSGERSEKIRTYNYHKNRVTDHRINLTLYKLNYILNGDLNTIIKKLIIKYNKK